MKKIKFLTVNTLFFQRLRNHFQLLRAHKPPWRRTETGQVQGQEGLCRRFQQIKC